MRVRRIQVHFRRRATTHQAGTARACALDAIPDRSSPRWWSRRDCRCRGRYDGIPRHTDL